MNVNLIFVMKVYTAKGHIDELIKLIKDSKDYRPEMDINEFSGDFVGNKDENVIGLLYGLKNLNVVQPDSDTSSLHKDSELRLILEKIDRALFGDIVVPENNPEPWEATEGSFIGSLYRSNESQSETVLFHLIALHLKLLIHPPEHGECPTCEEKVGRDKVCKNCGTKLRKDFSMKAPKVSIKKIVVLIVIALVLVTIVPCIQVIPEGSTGIRITMGKVDKNLIQPGPTYKLPFVQSIKTVNNKQQTYKFSDRIWGESSEQTVVYMEDVAVSYQIMPEYSVWLYTNVTDYQTNALPPTVVSSAMKAAMVELETDSVTNRAKIEPIAVDKLQKALNDKYEGKEVVHITSINIDNMDFEENYNKAIEQRQIAKLEYEKQQTEIKTQLEKANADKQEREIKAQAAANEKKIAADAEAESIKTVADAQAEANKKLANSITKDLVDYTKIEKWDGKLPQVSGGSSIIDMRDSNTSAGGGTQD